jgi:hypothetical protein
MSGTLLGAGAVVPGACGPKVGYPIGSQGPPAHGFIEGGVGYVG